MSLSKGGLKIILRDTTWIIFPSQKPLTLDDALGCAMARKLAHITWIFAIKKGKNKRRLYNKEFAKNFYDSFILIKFGDLKPSWPLAM